MLMVCVGLEPMEMSALTIFETRLVMTCPRVDHPVIIVLFPVCTDLIIEAISGNSWLMHDALH